MTTIVNETDLLALREAITNGTAKVEERAARIPLDFLPINDGAFTREGALAYARVLLATESKADGISNAEKALRAFATVNVQSDALRAALGFEADSIRYVARQHNMATERFALACGRMRKPEGGRTYKTVGAKYGETQADRDANLAIPRYTEDDYRAMRQAADDFNADSKATRVARDEADNNAHERALAFALSMEPKDS